MKNGTKKNNYLSINYWWKTGFGWHMPRRVNINFFLLKKSRERYL
jgi:hypothetical protein